MNENIRSTLGVGLILGVLALAPETVRFYLDARSEARHADFEAVAVFRTWSAKAFIRNGALIELDQKNKLPELSEAQEALAKRASTDFNLDLPQLRQNMQIAESINRATGTSQAKDLAAPATTLDDILKKGPNNAIDLSDEFATAEKADVAGALAMAEQHDLNEAFLYFIVALAVQLAAIFYGFRQIFLASRKAPT